MRVSIMQESVSLLWSKSSYLSVSRVNEQLRSAYLLCKSLSLAMEQMIVFELTKDKLTAKKRVSIMQESVCLYGENGRV